MAGLEFPTQKKPEVPSDESAFGGLPTPAWAMAKPKPAVAEKEKAAPAEKAKAEAKRAKQKKMRPSLDLSGLRTLEALLALVAVLAFAAVGTVIVWFWPELTWTLRRYF